MEDTIILDSGSGIDLFCNADWLQDIRLKDVPIVIGTNAGSLNIDQEGTLASYGKVPFSENAVTNIMFLALLQPGRQQGTKRQFCPVTLPHNSTTKNTYVDPAWPGTNDRPCFPAFEQLIKRCGQHNNPTF